MWDELADQIGQLLGRRFEICDRTPIGGGCINQAYAVADQQQTVFVKLNQSTQLAMFEAEFAGLQEMYRAQTIRVPQPLGCGIAGGSAFIAMEWLSLGGSSRTAWQVMGQNLAAMHRVSSDQGFGWQRDNTIGETHQPNPWTDSWLRFYQEHRLGYQFKLANRRGGHFPRERELLDALPELLSGHDPAPALVHGDLWSGNAAVTQDGEPVILDPATYYGDREVDIAMTELFGRFPTAFYQAYEAAYPLDDGYAARKPLYNLYHILNHFNLFGGGYASQANRMIDQILSHLI
ncbi:MAG: fructosamine kinase family protein [Cyanobacteria bacterium P01_G01_bin.38]